MIQIFLYFFFVIIKKQNYLYGESIEALITKYHDVKECRQIRYEKKTPSGKLFGPRKVHVRAVKNSENQEVLEILSSQESQQYSQKMEKP